MLSNSLWFPTHIDRAQETVFFRKIDVAAFEAVPFHDGRYDFLGGAARPVLFEDIIASSKLAETSHPPALVLHQSFCGSTYLARLLTVENKTASYREPQILIELSEHLGSGGSLDLTAALLTRLSVGPDGETPAFVKPSNWPNGFLAESGALSGSRIVLIDIDLQAYLVANLRGGNHRIRYSLNLLNHLLPTAPEWSDAVEEAKGLLETSGLIATLRLLSILHMIQCCDFDRIVARDDCTVTRLSHRDIKAMPLTTAERAARALGLDVSRDDLTTNLARHSNQHAKSLLPNEFSLVKEAARNMEIINSYARELDAALRWVDGNYDVENGTV